MKTLTKAGTSSTLVVALHSFRSTRENMASVCHEVSIAYPNADIFAPQLPNSMWSSADPQEIARQLMGEIDSICAEHPTQYQTVIFVGHSIGALLARMTFLLARERKESEVCWSDRVDRIILLAGMNRGWQVGHYLGFFKTFAWFTGIFVGSLYQVVTHRHLLIMSVRRGCPFITHLRVRWIQLSNREKIPLTIQLLGSVDDMVSPADNIDIVAGRSFVYLDVPYSGHESVVEMHATKRVNTREHGWVTQGFLRRQVLHAALTQNAAELARSEVTPVDTVPEQADLDVRHVIFVIHGIRDVGHWTQKIARSILKLSTTDQPQVKLATETSSYGFFPMLPFLLPWTRHEKVSWFMDQYAETLARYPKAKFSFVGHSNGTYLLGRALQLYPFCKFENVVLAGSVLSSGYDWESIVGKQVKGVMNFVASSDWVVAFFPKTIELLRLQDLGSGGHDGFSKLQEGNLYYVEGAHSAALAEENWDTIASFIVTGKLPAIPANLKIKRQHWLVAALAKIPWIVWIILALIIFGIGQMIWQSGFGEMETAFMMVAYVWVIWKIITKL